MDNTARIRKQWLISLFLYSGFFCIFWFVDNFFIKSRNVLWPAPRGYVFSFAISMSIIAFFAFALYYSAYKKRSLGFLFVVMLFFAVDGVAFVQTFLSYLITHSTSDVDYIRILFVYIAHISFTIYFLVNCYRLYRVNSAEF